MEFTLLHSASFYNFSKYQADKPQEIAILYMKK